MNQSLTKAEKLKSAERISQVYREGKKLKQSFLLLFYLPSQTENHRIAVAVPKRRVALAVKRNRIKRQLREAYRRAKHRLPETPPCDFIVMYLGSDPPDAQKLERAFDKLLAKWGNSEGL